MYTINTSQLKNHKREENRQVIFENEPSKQQIVSIIDILIESCVCQYLQDLPVDTHDSQRYNSVDDTENIVING